MTDTAKPMTDIAAAIERAEAGHAFYVDGNWRCQTVRLDDLQLILAAARKSLEASTTTRKPIPLDDVQQAETPKRKWAEWSTLFSSQKTISFHMDDQSGMQVKRTRDGLKIRYRVKP